MVDMSLLLAVLHFLVGIALGSVCWGTVRA